MTPQETPQEDPRLPRTIDHDVEYQRALVETSNYLDNPLGMISDDPQGASDKRFVRQNNFIIAYLMQLNQKLDIILSKASLTTDSVVKQQESIKASGDLIARQYETIQRLDHLLVVETQQYQNSIQELTSQLSHVLQMSSRHTETTQSSQTSMSKRQPRSTKFAWK